MSDKTLNNIYQNTDFLLRQPDIQLKKKHSRKALTNDRGQKKRNVGKRLKEKATNEAIKKEKARFNEKEPLIYSESGARAPDLVERSADSLHYMYNSASEGKKCFKWVIQPVTLAKFFSELWEKKPLLVKRHNQDYFKNLFNSKDLDRILREKHLQFSKNIDITSYINGKRETHNPDGRCYAPVVWDFYQNGCSVRLLNPQTYSRTVWKLCSVLQEYFGSFVGANVYLTPAGTQGFAPHYDDIEAFILQLEGRKLWKLYSPRSPSEELPRYSSPNFSREVIGEPILSVELQAGDLLYFPRGIIHQASTPEDSHSLHITLSTCQKNTWGDLLEKLVPQALSLAITEDIEFRHSLPLDYLKHMGVANCDVESPERDEFLKKIHHLFSKLVQFAPIDSAVDQMAKTFIHDCLPPVLTEREKRCSIHGSAERWDNGQVVGAAELDPDTEIKFVRQGVIRLVMEEEYVRLYHTLENSRIYHEEEPQYIDIGGERAPAVEFLLHSYPEYVSIDALPLPTLEEKMDLASLLYDKGLLVTREPLPEND
ncbi:bifunctional lysine-specific demethylase and histidyl-hydroxylase NO66 isoform X2 [Tachypleus tridentatus]